MNNNSDDFDSENEEIEGEIIFEGKKEQIPKSKESNNNNITNYLIIQSINNTLTCLLEENKKLINYHQIIRLQSKMSFNSHSIPSISILEYLKRIQMYSKIESSTLICSLIYIDRLCNLGEIILTYYNIHRILFVAILISIKYNEDRYYENVYYAKIAGISSRELKNIEYDFLVIINFELFISEDEYLKYKKYLENFYEQLNE